MSLPSHRKGHFEKKTISSGPAGQEWPGFRQPLSSHRNVRKVKALTVIHRRETACNPALIEIQRKGSIEKHPFGQTRCTLGPPIFCGMESPLSQCLYHSGSTVFQDVRYVDPNNRQEPIRNGNLRARDIHSTVLDAILERTYFSACRTPLGCSDTYHLLATDKGIRPITLRIPRIDLNRAAGSP
jgi:hypothetical protein